ncbi:hypothetical protein DL764_004670 [Monosporascus ibericus]|uniref:Cytochrome P450 n=1 Tax=Monosporascus ibericus TaxID=155417 RepID=A0A4Q4TFQ9_9PEZI|nr:hypothetical protein DL764_004670 [Monosporascus ibericus]
MGPKNLVVLSDPAQLRELFQRRGALYSGRPYMYIPQEHVMKPGDSHVLFMQDGSALREWKTAAREMTDQKSVAKLAPLQVGLASKLVWQLAKDPAGWSRYSGEWSLSVPILCVAGQTLDDYPHGFGEYYLDVQKQWLELLEPGNTPPVDIYPFLAYVPDFLARWKARAAHASKVLYDVYGCLVNAAKEKAASGKQYPYTPVLVRLIRERNFSPDRGKEGDEESFGDTKPPIRDSQLLSLGSGLLDASVDSMHAVVETLILIMVKHPSKLARLRAEIDAVTNYRENTGKYDK